MREEQVKERSVFDAKADGLMCPALLELVCEALASPGRAPGASECPTRSAVGSVQRRMLAPVQGPGPQPWRLEATAHTWLHACSAVQGSTSW